MYNIINSLGGFITLLFQFSLVIGIVMILIYVVGNWLSDSRMFSQSPRFIRHITYKIIEFSHVWGPKFIILYILGNLLVQFLNFIL